MTTSRRSRQSQEVREFILRNVKEHSNDITTLAAGKFGLSRQAINRYVRCLTDEGLLTAEGNTSARRYGLRNFVKGSYEIQLTAGLAEDAIWRNRFLPLTEGLPENVLEICQYGFTEILNNAIDHSVSEDCLIHYEQDYCEARMLIIDHGVGIFQKIQNDFGLVDARSALLELSKGRLTSDKKRHSGEGVFFTSRMFDQFSIRSGNLFYLRKRRYPNSEWLIESGDLSGDDTVTGTAVFMDIATDAKQTMRGVFDEFQGDDLRFRKTHVPIKLGKYPNEQLVSRSQAKRILARFDQFGEVLLDFAGIDTVGRAFIDEIFRVFRLEHPDTNVLWMHTTPEIEKMISGVMMYADYQAPVGD